MATPEEVTKLASLARLHIPEAKTEAFAKEFDAILAYVGTLEKLSLPKDMKRSVSVVHNVTRPDGEPHESGVYTEAVVTAFPEKQGDYLSVKQIITHD